MTETPARKNGPDPNADADATEAEKNRKLTEYLRANAIRITADANVTKPARQSAGPGRRPPARAPGMAFARIVGLAALVVLMALASIHAYFYEKEAR
ncbi:hypothetical protein JNB71_10735 [Rhizobium herbae]|uniref:Uncharacterized protein n=1 Tax=Rhizobium herbae TaxID=508661 RepID=A0ABS7HAR1_9HYPH|nr:hypothetical protein [Rhizobium herbae]MBW9063796.1 hypothetical protein [Rhizobium herbae]